MPVEVYSKVTRSVPRRGVILALLLLLSVSMLAAAMVHRRGGMRLSSAFREPNWGASFQLPSGFELRGRGYYERWQMLRFSGPLDRGLVGELFVWQRPLESNVGPDMLAEAVLAMTAAVVDREVGAPQPSPAAEELRIGTARAVEFWSADRSLVARAAVWEGFVYAVSLATPNGVITDAAYERFEACCRSFTPATAAPLERRKGL